MTESLQGFEVKELVLDYLAYICYKTNVPATTDIKKLSSELQKKNYIEEKDERGFLMFVSKVS